LEPFRFAIFFTSRVVSVRGLMPVR
jgi:hypothetical protein